MGTRWLKAIELSLPRPVTLPALVFALVARRSLAQSAVVAPWVLEVTAAEVDGRCGDTRIAVPGMVRIGDEGKATADRHRGCVALRRFRRLRIVVIVRLRYNKPSTWYGGPVNCGDELRPLVLYQFPLQKCHALPSCAVAGRLSACSLALAGIPAACLEPIASARRARVPAW